MSDTAIRFENISKQYRLGNIGTGTLSHDLNRWWQVNIRGKDDPYLKIGQVNDRSAASTSDYVWALRDINFEVKQGEVLGIIGKNGAGKSTLLKILSRVTAPTTGRITAFGRIASLLEVGTGFHPEMTGRENIYMNGAIMGMTKSEITRKFDEIVDFSGVEKYIDTPVKRYSSGMTVRLGFAIAAHLEPEILVVDEVLAVGDAEFQKKAIGKMQDVSKGEGRTVLFVSHNMASIRNLCHNSILLENGYIIFNDSAGNTIDYYLKYKNNELRLQDISETNKYRRGIISSFVKIEAIGFTDKRARNIYATNEPISFYLRVICISGKNKIRVAGSIFNSEENRIGMFFAKNHYVISEGEKIQIEVIIVNHNLTIGDYYMSISLGNGDHTTGNTEFDILYEVLRFEILRELDEDEETGIVKWNRNWGNILFPVHTNSVTI